MLEPMAQRQPTPEVQTADQGEPAIDARSTGELTIDELARATGMTVRNIRAHQGRGLIPPPQVRGRTGYYGPEHVNRLRLVQEMQAEGFNLRAIQRVLDSADGGGAEMLDFGRTLLRSFVPEDPEFMTAEELASRFGELDARLLRKAQGLGIVRPIGDGGYEIPSPTLVRAGEELMALGIPLEHALAVAERIERHTGAIARAFHRLFMQDVLGSSGPRDRTPAEWARVREALERLSPLAAEAVRAGFQQTMSRLVERELAKTIGD
jgi:DNA-binding transcriptional MerR regulator